MWTYYHRSDIRFGLFITDLTWDLDLLSQIWHKIWTYYHSSDVRFPLIITDRSWDIDLSSQIWYLKYLVLGDLIMDSVSHIKSVIFCLKLWSILWLCVLSYDQICDFVSWVMIKSVILRRKLWSNLWFCVLSYDQICDYVS